MDNDNVGWMGVHKATMVKKGYYINHYMLESTQVVRTNT